MNDLKTIILEGKEYWLLPKIDPDYNANNQIANVLRTLEWEVQKIEYALEKMNGLGDDLKILKDKILDSINSLRSMK